MWFAPLLPAAALLQELPPITGSILATEAGADGCSITGGVAIAGAIAATPGGADSCAIAGVVAISGTLSAADGPADGCVITGSLGPAPGVYLPTPHRFASAGRRADFASPSRSTSWVPERRAAAWAVSARGLTLTR